MIDRDQIGQHFIVDFDGTDVPPHVERLVNEGRIGGVILFAKNVRAPEQVRRLCADLQALAKSAGLPPLLITIDQEGGIVNRLIEGFTVFPGAMAIGASGRSDDAATAGRITARELKAVGINTNHAPVLDVNTNPENPIINIRAFSDDPGLVARLGCAYVRAARAEGVLATVKHFPGHGATPVDSHLELPVVDKDSGALGREELYPFAQAFDEGAEGMMAAHIVFPALDPSRPATLAPLVMQKLLREQMQFAGIAMTDSMAMRAVAAHWTRAEATVAALAAGLDVVMAVGSEQDQWASLEAARQAVDDGRLDRRQLDKSGARIARIKARYASAPSDAGPVGAEAHLRAAQEIADRAVTLVRSTASRIPLQGRTAVVHVGEEQWRGTSQRFADLLSDLGVDAVVASPEQAGDAARGSVVAASHSWRSQVPARVIPAMHARLGDRLVVVGFGAPYELRSFPQVHTYFTAYGPDLPSLKAAAKTLAGQLTPTGRLPVSIPGLYPRGHRADP